MADNNRYVKVGKTNMSEKMIVKMENITKRFGPVAALKDVSFEKARRMRFWARMALESLH